MPASEITFAEMLKEIGYQTACVWGNGMFRTEGRLSNGCPMRRDLIIILGKRGANDGEIGFAQQQ